MQYISELSDSLSAVAAPNTREDTTWDTSSPTPHTDCVMSHSPYTLYTQSVNVKKSNGTAFIKIKIL